MTQQSSNIPLNVPMSWSQVWMRVLTQPSPLTFQAILTDPTASNRRAYTWTAVTSLIQVVLVLIIQIPALSRLPATFQNARNANAAPLVLPFTVLYLCLIPLAPALAVLGLIINVAITQFVAKALGGIGTYGQLTYAFAAYMSPFGLLSSVLGYSPVGICLALPLAIYGLALHVMAVKGVNQFSWGKSILSIFMIPILILLVAIVFAIITALSASVSNHR